MSYTWSLCNDDTELLGRGLPRMKPIAKAEGSFNRSNGHMSVTKVSLQTGGHQLWFKMERDRLRQVYLPKNEYFTGFQQRYMEATGQVLSCTMILQP